MKLYDTDKIESMNTILNKMFNPPITGGAGASEGPTTGENELVEGESFSR